MTGVYALSSTSAQAVAYGLIGALVLFGYVVLKFVKAVTTKAVLLVVLLGLVLGLWSGRSDLSKCADQLRDKMKQGDFSTTTCDFFGVWDAKVGLK